MKKLILVTVTAVLLIVSGCTKKESVTGSDGTPTQAAVTSNDGIAGKIELAPLLERNPISKTAVIYLIARNPGETAGPPIAVKQITQPFHFPIPFTLSKENSMLPDAPFTGPFALTARIAQSGSATPAQPGDLEGEVATGPVKLGQRDVAIRIAQVRP